MIWDVQKASVWKRIAAALLDLIVLSIVSVGVALVMSAILDYDTHQTTYKNYLLSYEEKYNVKFEMTNEEYEALSEAQKQNYVDAYNDLISNEDVLKEFTLVQSFTYLIISIGLFISTFILDFIVPKVLKNGQTIGKKVFGLGVIKADGVKIGSISLFIRSILGKYTIETMIPVLIAIMIYMNSIGIIGPIIIFAILILQIVMMCITQSNQCIHDLISGTIVVDLNSQMVFESEQELLEYQKRVHEEAVKREIY